ncbi:MAG: cyclophane-forming radical SAM/SPASM peptide maturase GrrM/OscB [Synechococcaceae cyanobacterium]|nr:cyclophane-forming radical SAM/SPASM peptide maturase GrrM/OscB [Synechococcaceae cyanobacterium]
MGPTEGYGPLQLLVIQPTPFCNLDCDYCYLPGRGKRDRLSLEILDAALDRVLESPFVQRPFLLLWHAGEPLTMPMAFYDAAGERIQAALQRHGLPPETIQQSVQTNAVVINEAWCDCLQRNRMHVGVSMDGPAFLHDRHRRTRAGLASHAACLRGIKHLQTRGIPFQVISVITEESLHHPDEMFQFFLEHGIDNLAFNMEETEGVHRHSSLSGAQVEQAYRRFLARFWELWQPHAQRMRVREFDAVCAVASSDGRLDRTDMNNPFAIVNVDVHGNISTFDPELLSVRTDTYGDFVLGHVLQDSLLDIANSDKFRRIQSDIASGVARCRQECEYFGLCGGGACSNKYWENGSFDCSETQACRYRIKLTAEVVLAALERALNLPAA